VASNLVPEAMVAIPESFFAGEIDLSRALQLELSPLIDALFLEVSPIPVKEALAAIGYGNGKTRPPLVPMGEASREKLLSELIHWFPDVQRAGNPAFTGG